MQTVPDLCMLDSERASPSITPLFKSVLSFSLQQRSLDRVERESSREGSRSPESKFAHTKSILRLLEMVSKESKRGILHERLQLLRSITNSHAQNNASIIVDASKYIEELKKKVEQLNQELENSQSSSSYQLPVVHVETLMNGYQVNVYSEKSCPGLLVYVLEVFEELGLTVLEARASCSDSFHLEAIGREENDEQCGEMDATKVKQATLRAIENWRQITQQE